MNRGGAPAPRVDLPVGGMTCAACVGHVEAALRKTPFVRAADVSLMTRSAAVTVDEVAWTPEAREATVAELVRVVEAAGYFAHEPDDDEDVLSAQRRGDEALSEEARERARRAGVSLVAATLAMILSMPIMHGSQGHDVLSHQLMRVMDPPVRAALPWLYRIEPRVLMAVLMGLFLPVLAWVIAPLARRAFAALRAGSTDMNTLVVLGASASVASSALGDVAIDAALFIVGFVLLGQAAEGRARGRTSAALSALAGLRVDRARRELGDGEVAEVATAELRVGDRVLVAPGERIVGDGVVVEGSGSVSEALLTGESRAVSKTIGAPVLGGSVNGPHPLTVELTRLGKHSTVHQLLRLLREAQGRRAPTQRLADRVAAVFVPAMIALAVATFVGWWLAADVAVAARYAVAVLVVACPCAMGLAVPTAILVATGHAARAGVLLKGGDVLERLASTKVVVFDKTGTLTHGEPTVSRVVARSGSLCTRSEAEVLALAAAVERGSEHPLGKAIVSLAKERGLKPARAKAIRTVEGAGVVGEVGGIEVGVGNDRLLAHLGVESSERAGHAWSDELGGALFVVEAGTIVGALELADAARPDARQAVEALRALGVEARMLTGDRRPTAEAIAREVGIAQNDVRAEVLPAEKLAEIEALRSDRAVVFVGDGVNDAAALAAATVGVGIATGADVAAAAADVVLLRPRLMAVPEGIALSRATKRKMVQNLGWAFGYNLVMLPLAMGLFSGLGLRLSPALAAVAMSLSSVTVVLNSLLLRPRMLGSAR
jgi:P-type Cu+ transporter